MQWLLLLVVGIAIVSQFRPGRRNAGTLRRAEEALRTESEQRTLTTLRYYALDTSEYPYCKMFHTEIFYALIKLPANK